MDDIEWLEGDTHEELIQKMIGRDEWSMATLLINAAFVNNFLSLCDASLNETVHALQTNSCISWLLLETLPNLPTRKMLRRFRILCTTLGSMAGVRTIRVDYRAIFSITHVDILKAMPHIKNFHLCFSDTDEFTMFELSEALRNCTCLESIDFGIPLPYYQTVLPSLHALTLLNAIELTDGQGGLVSQDSAQAIADVLGVGRQLDLQLDSFNFTLEGAQNIFCLALAASSVISITLQGCLFTDPVSLVNAISQPQVQKLYLYRFGFPGHQHDEFPNLLSQQIHRMTHLHDLTYNDFVPADQIGREDLLLANDRALVRLGRAVAQCHELQTLSLSFKKLIPELDEALAACVAPVNSQLTYINIDCDSLESENDMRLTESPLFLKALERNFTVTNIYLETAYRHGGPIDPWCPHLKKSIETLCRLNVAGRKYMVKDAGDNDAGLRTLGAVRDNLDCSFYHLSRENPSLCQQARTRKRTRNDGA